MSLGSLDVVDFVSLGSSGCGGLCVVESGEHFISFEKLLSLYIYIICVYIIP